MRAMTSDKGGMALFLWDEKILNGTRKHLGIF